MVLPFPFAQQPGFFPSLGNDLVGRRPNLRDYFGMDPAAPPAPTPGMRLPYLGPETAPLMDFLKQNPQALITGTSNPDFQYPLFGGISELAQPLATRDEADRGKMEAQVFGEQTLGNLLQLPQRSMDFANNTFLTPGVDFFKQGAESYATGSLGAQSAIEGALGDAATYMTSTVGENEERAQESALDRLHLGSGVNMQDVEPTVPQKLLQLQQAIGRPLKIISGFRDPDHNKRIDGAEKSQHLHGRAVDVDVSDLSQEERIVLKDYAEQLGFTGIGFYKNSMHFDVREGGPARWGPDRTRASVPAWANQSSGQKLEIPLGPAPTAGQVPMPPMAGMPPYLPYPNAPELPPPPGIEVPNYGGLWSASGMGIPPRTPNYGLVENPPGLTPPQTIPEQVFRDFVSAVEKAGPEEVSQEDQNQRTYLAALGGLAAGAAAADPSQIGQLLASMGAGGLQGLLTATEMELEEDKEYQEALRQHQLAVAQAEMAAQEAIVNQRNIGIDFQNREALRGYEGRLAGEDLRQRYDNAMQQYRANTFNTMVRAAEAQTNALNRVAERQWSWATEGAKLAWETKLAERGDFLRWGEVASATQDANMQRLYQRDLAQFELDEEVRNLPAAKIAGNNLITHRKKGDQLVAEVTPLGELYDGLKGIKEQLSLIGDTPAGKVLKHQLALSFGVGMGNPGMLYAMAADDLKDRLMEIDPEAFEVMRDQIMAEMEGRQLFPGTKEAAEYFDKRLSDLVMESLTENPGTLKDIAPFSPAAAATIEVMGTRP